MFKTLKFISSEESTPDHNSKILYILGGNAPVFGMHTLHWCEIEDGEFTGEIASMDDECPDGWGVIGLVNGEVMPDAIYWMSVEQFEEVVR